MTKLPFIFRLLRGVFMVGPELRRLNRNIETYLRSQGVLTAVEEDRLRAEPGPTLQALPFDHDQQWLAEVKERQRLGEEISPEEIQRAAERFIALEDAKWSRE